ncbi:MAG: DUF1819 family protein [Candidatus Reddybacter sp.]
MPGLIVSDKAIASEYLGDLLAGGLLLRESKVLSVVLLSNPSLEEWAHLVDKENILQKNTVHTARRVAIAVKQRMSPMGEEFLRDFVEADSESSNQLLLFAMLIRSKAMREFMTTVVSDARRIYQDELHISSWIEFFTARSRSIVGLESYAESTVRRMGNNVFRMLADCGYLSEGRTRKLQKPFILPIVSDWANRMSRMDVLEAMES